MAHIDLAPAAHTLTYKEVLFRKYAHHTSVFSKKPGLEVDAAWHELLEGICLPLCSEYYIEMGLGMNIRVSEEWLSPYGAKSVAFADGSGYLVQLAVYHELHCLVSNIYYRKQDSFVFTEGYRIEKTKAMDIPRTLLRKLVSVRNRRRRISRRYVH